MVKKSLLFCSFIFLISSCAHKKLSSTSSAHSRKKTDISEVKNKDSKIDIVSNSEIETESENTSIENNNIKKTVTEKNDNFFLSEKDRLFFELSGENFKDLDEESIFEKIMDKYRNNDLRAMEAYSNLLINKYPLSHLADNALYYEGMLALNSKNYGKSLEYFQKVIALYPQSNKAVSALFAKGVLYRKMNLNSESESILKDLQHRFPGSPESLRAELEIKALTK